MKTRKNEIESRIGTEVDFGATIMMILLFIAFISATFYIGVVGLMG